MIQLFIQYVHRLSTLCGWLSSALLAGAVLVVCQMVWMRYLIDSPTIWQTDFVIYSLVAAIFLGAPSVQQQKGHVNMDLIMHYAGPAQRSCLKAFGLLACLIFTSVIAWTGIELALEAWRGNWQTETVWALALWIPYSAFALGISVLLLQFIADLLSLLTDH
jgi:TRAP-type C4-dicarboxylate transport system permease small subunit